ncbi:hypothetical protein A7985_25320 [Pseudoalteromonas luteoviolacea]|uniref:DUF4329 domain-containing protein n=1 Tax=Pseudoalteromonas luteoviolacea TaxID=43657 RepID=A0A1C0TIL0_9GAMM|nr:hypothetical protein A7985_25320 [Pseudoalteromonas luteoviolacea]
MSCAYYAAAATAAYSAGSTFAVTGSLNKGLLAGFSAAAMPGGEGIGAIAASAVIGGATSKLMGGNFGHGFFSAGLGAAAGGIGRGIRNPVGQVLVGAIVGGTVSKVTGGKFANGAFSAAFAAALRADWGGGKWRKRNHQLNSSEAPSESQVTLSKQDLKAREALEIANKKSIKDNLEYGGIIYVEDGEYHYTTPLQGTDQGFDLNKSLALVPEAAIVVGDYHTHGDYSIYNRKTGQAIRTSDPKRDHFNSDNFSTPDLNGIRNDASIGGIYRGYLGTPSGRLLAFDPYKNIVYGLKGN